MTGVRAIEHITITTGATRMSSRSEVEEAAISQVRDSLSAGVDIRGWHVILLRAETGGAVFDLSHAGIVVARCWLCLITGLTDAMWEAAARSTIDDRVTLHRPRGIPWLATALLPGALRVSPEALMQAGDLERVVAWALIDGV